MMLLRRADKRRRDDITDVVGKVDAGWESAGGAKELLEIHAHALAINVLSPLIPVVRCHKRVTQPYESDSTGLKRLGWWVLSVCVKRVSVVGAARLLMRALRPQVLCFSHDGQLLVTGAVDCAISVWDLSKRALKRTIQGHAAPITALLFTPDGKTLVSGCMQGLIAFWDITTGRQISKFKNLLCHRELTALRY